MDWSYKGGQWTNYKTGAAYVRNDDGTGKFFDPALRQWWTVAKSEREIFEQTIGIKAEIEKTEKKSIWGLALIGAVMLFLIK